NPREVLQLFKSLKSATHVKHYLEQDNTLKNEQPALWQLIQKINPCSDIQLLIEQQINEEPPLLINKGGVIKQGVDEALDDLRTIAYSGKEYLTRIQQEESTKTGIPSLKIAFNNVFGYYLEVTNTHKDKVPQEWIRKQTLANAERYITPQLKEYE